jgi:hypothetical protein
MLMPIAEGVFLGGAGKWCGPIVPDVCGLCCSGECGLAWTGRKNCLSECGEGIIPGWMKGGEKSSTDELMDAIE